MSIQMKLKNAQKLIKDIEKKRDNWDERSQFKIKGVGNLSRASLDQIEYYAETYIKNGGSGFQGLMKPVGEVREVLDKYSLIDESQESIW